MKVPNIFGVRGLNVVLQSERAECGLACIAMISSYHGHDVNLRGLRTKFPTSSRGVNLMQIVEIAQKIGLHCRPLQVELDQLYQLQCPAILHWDMNHFVVLKSVRNGKVTIHDPAIGERVLKLQSCSKHFTGIALELSPTETFDPEPAVVRLSFRSLLGKITGLKRSLLQIFLLSMLLLTFTVVTPIGVQFIIDEVLVSKDFQLLNLVLLSLVAVMIFQSTSFFFRGMLVARLGGLFALQFGSSLFMKLLDRSIDFFEKRHMGDIISKFQSLYEIKRFLALSFTVGIIDGIMGILMLLMIVVYSGKLSLVVLASISLYSLVRFASYLPLRNLQEESLIARSKENTNFIESIRSVQTLKLYNAIGSRQAVWQNLFARVIGADARTEAFKAGFESSNQLLFGLERCLILYFGANMVLSQEMTAGMFVAFISYRDQFVDRISSLLEKFIDFKLLRLHVDRISDLAIDNEPESMVEGDQIHDLNGRLTGTGLSFRYDSQSPTVFEDLSFDIRVGEHVAIVGPSGAGKTTLVKVMLGLLKPEKGRLLVDGQLAQKLNPSYRKQIATVMQDDQLLSGSIQENISFFDDTPDLDRVYECAKKASIYVDIMAMPMQFNSLVGDMGNALSGGQKQRILLARALYRKPKILFLDEATSHLDQGKEAIINEAIADLNMTRIVIAHRKETIEAADRVLFFDGKSLRSSNS